MLCHITLDGQGKRSPPIPTEQLLPSKEPCCTYGMWEEKSRNAQVLTVAVVVTMSGVLVNFSAAAKTPWVKVINYLRRQCQVLVKA